MFLTIHRDWSRTRCLKRENDIPTSILMAIQDVTEMKKAELQSRSAIEDTYRAAQAASEAKRTFLFNMSHDMRTPMNAIMGFSRLLEQNADRPDKVRKYSAKINSAGYHLLDLINEVLDISKIESGKQTLTIAEFSLHELISELAAVTRTLAREKEQTFLVELSNTEQDRLMGDRLRLNEILMNLLSNAIKYTPKKGCIKLTVKSLPQITPGVCPAVLSCFRQRHPGHRPGHDHRQKSGGSDGRHHPGEECQRPR